MNQRCKSHLFFSLALLMFVTALGCNSDKDDNANRVMPKTRKAIEFKNEVESNVEVPQGLEDLTFTDTDGKQVAVKNYLGNQNLVIVFTRGFSGSLCPFCKTQTSRLVANYEKFSDAETEVLVVYPGTKDHLEEFITAAKTSDKGQVDAVPFPIVLDEEFEAVNFFDIKSNLAHPSTFVINKKGQVKLAYVGQDSSADRPSVAAILGKLKSANSN